MQMSIEGSPAVPKSSMRKIRPLQNKSFKWIKGIQIPSHPFDGIPWVKKLPKFFNLASDLFFCGLINTQTLDIIVNKIKNHSNVLKKRVNTQKEQIRSKWNRSPDFSWNRSHRCHYLQGFQHVQYNYVRGKLNTELR